MSSAGEGSETSSTPGGIGQPHNFLRPARANSALYKLDAMMFPTGDPFAYPNQQPLMDFPPPGRQQQPSGQSPDSMQFYIPSLYDDIEGQLLGPLPPYLVHGQTQPGGGGMEINSQVYHATSMLSMPPLHGHGHGHGAGGGAGLAAQQRHQHQRVIDAMLADPNFRGDWGDVMGGGYRHL